MRVIVILILITIAIAMVRMLIRDVFKAVGKSMDSSSSDSRQSSPAEDPEPSTTGRLVKDPETGSYIDERTALKAEINGQTYHFESADTRDAYVRKNRS